MADPRAADLAADIIAAAKSGEIRDRASLQNLKLKLCKRYGLQGVPPNSEILAEVRPEDRDLLLPLLLKKPMRTMSGVAAVAVMTSPCDCPHGKCAYCPGGVSNDSPQSYTGKEPAARRAGRNGYDPYLQVSDRIKQLSDIGHDTAKIELIIMGGTFTCRDPEYQEWFVRRCFDALNGRDSDSLEEAQRLNGSSDHRCVAMTVETRPDVFDAAQIERAMALGATRAELGVQILDDEVLAGVDRGHGVEEVRRCTKECREHGLALCYHLMPGLPGSDPEKDMECFRKVFSDPDFRPDMLKIYTTLVISGTKLYEMWESGEYEPYDVDTAAALISDMKSEVPEYARIQRIQRDIPVPQITAGILKSNLRQIVEDRMASEGRACRCIRCREVGHTGAVLEDPSKIALKTLEYGASDGTELFISYEYEDSLVGYVRLRLSGCEDAILRELKVFGKMAVPGGGGSWQHRGFGGALLSEAERVAKEAGRPRLRVTCAAGARGYYASKGYHEEFPYMVKDL
jgi:elongator complex protein 3